MTNIERIDQACWETYQRYQGRYSNQEKIYEHLNYALREGVNNNFLGFTRQNGAREQVMSMKPSEFDAEFLKALVRTVAYKRETMDPEFGKGTAIFNLNAVTDQTPVYMVENGLVGTMLEVNKDPDSYDMERGQIGFEWLNYQPVRDAVISSFVHNRYERNISERVDDGMLTPEEQELINDIDAYSIRKQNGFHI